MPTWKKYKLGELADIRRGASPRPVMDPKYFGGSIHWIKIGDATATPSRYVESTKEFVTELGKSKSVFLEKGSLILSNSGVSAAVPHLLGVDGCIHDGWVSFSNYNGIDPLFLFYWFKVNTLRIRDLATGSVFINLNTTMVKDFVINLPPLPSQKCIAEILGALDDKIELNLQMNKTLEEMAMALYKHWFVDFGPFKDGEFVDSELGKIPKGWEVKTLSEVTSKITDGSHFSPKTTEVGIPMASVKDMHNWGINIESCRKINRTDFEDLVRNDCRPLKNDVLIAKDGSYLKHVFLVEEDLDLVVLSSIAILRPNLQLHPLLLTLYLKLDEVKKRMESIVSGAVIQRIVLKDFRKFKILMAPKEIQDEVINQIEPLINQCWLNIHENIELTVTRDYLLPKLISGEVEVKEAEDKIKEMI